MIKKFENYTSDSIDKETIDSASVINFTAPNGDTYQHILQFVLPYHENEVIGRTKEYIPKGTAWDVSRPIFKFDKFEKDFGSLGTGLVRRSVVTSAIVYDGKLYRNDQYELITYRNKSKRENKPLYMLKYVTIRNDRKEYSQEGLDKMKEMYPEFVYKNE